jgi:hypothetical protein
MCQDYRRRTAADRWFEHLSWVRDNVVKPPLADHFHGQHMVLGIQEQNAKLLLFQNGHRGRNLSGGISCGMHPAALRSGRRCAPTQLERRQQASCLGGPNPRERGQFLRTAAAQPTNARLTAQTDQPTPQV